MFVPFLSYSTAVPVGMQSEIISSILPSAAMLLGLVCVASYISTRIVKRII